MVLKLSQSYSEVCPEYYLNCAVILKQHESMKIIPNINQPAQIV